MTEALNSSIILQICCIFFDLLLITIFFSQKRLKSKENKIFKFLMISNFIGLILDIVSIFTMLNINKMPIINLIATKTYLLYYYAWIALFTYYIVSISKLIKKEENIDKLFMYISIIITFLIYYLPQEYKFTSLGMNTAGPAVDLVYIIVTIYLFVCFICMMKHLIKESKTEVINKYSPLIIFMIVGTAAMIIQKINPTLILIPAVETFVTFLMYFTLENPDLKLIEELEKNRNLMENSMEDKSVFLFKISQEIKQPVKNIGDAVKYYKENDLSDTEIRQNYARIENNVNDLVFLINDTLNVSTMDINRVRKIDTSYNSINLFDSLKLKTENKIKKLKKNDKVRLNYSVSSAIPEILYGDSIKIKQILNAVLNNAVENIERGYIDFEINCITRYDTTRLFINIRDTGKGMDIEKINDAMSQEFEFDEKEIENLEKADVNLKVAIKLIRILDGSINIKSHTDGGTEVNIVIDQGCDSFNKNNEILDKYKSYSENNKILVVDDDNKEIKKIVTILSKNNITSSTSLFGRDAIDKIRTGEKYDLIIMDDEMVPDNALPTLYELKKMKRFSTPVVVMLNKEKEFIKEHYLEDGFVDFIMKDQLEKEIKRIIDKYL